MKSIQSLPERVDVAIVGGGIIGVSTAYALSRAGVSVAVFEKSTIACEQSSRNWGWVRSLMRDLPEIPLALLANRLWDEIQDQTDVGFRHSGILYLARTPAELDDYRRWLDTARPLGVDAVMLDRTQVSEHLPNARESWIGGLYSRSDGVAEPALATQGIAGLARRHGAHVREHCAARGLSMRGGGAWAVHTEHGSIQADAVLVAGGAWSRLFCGNLGVSLPQLKVRASVLSTPPVSPPLDIAVNGRDFTCRPRADGGYTVSQFNASYTDIVPDSFRLFRHFLPAWVKSSGLVKLRFGRAFFRELRVKRRFGPDGVTPFEQRRVLDPGPSRAAARSSLEKLAQVFPAFETAPVREMWGGYIDVTPDALPIISPVAGHVGLYVATGFSGHGFGIGPAVGEVAAKMVLNQEPEIDLAPFRLSRF